MTDGQSVNILLVEDDEIDERAVKRGFVRNEIDNPIHVARDGIEALDMLRGTGGRTPVPRPFMILLDLNMPRMNGLEFLAELRKDSDLKESIVFVLTTSKEDRDIAAAYEKNVAGYIAKADAGKEFLNLAQMLQNYVVIVQFPPETKDGL